MKAWNSTLNSSTKPMKRGKITPRAKPLAGILRTANLSATSKPSLSVKPRTRKCTVCRTSFAQQRIDQKVCGLECAATAGRIATDKAERKALKARLHAERRAEKVRREALKSIGELKADAQKAFNAYIRYRDKDLPCICCGSWGKGNWSRGGIWDAGHYRSRGSADHLRFDERNVHKQLKQCNRYEAGRAVDYRIGLIKRIGLTTVEALDADQTIVKWTREALVAIKVEYQAKLKALMANNNSIGEAA